MAMPAGRGLELAISAIAKALATGRRWVAYSVAIVLAACFGFLAREAIMEALPGNHPHIGPPPPYVQGVGPKSRWAIDWLKTNTDRSARVLFETTRGRFYDGASIAGYVAAVADREFIGGPYHQFFFAGYWDGYAFGRPIEKLEPTVFHRYLDLYNIGWIMAFSPRSREYLATVPGVKLASEFERLAAYRVERPFSYFYKGSGRIAARRYNSIELTALTGKEVIVKYHFLPGLTSIPSASIHPVFLEDDPIPFIQILNPPPDIRLFVEGFAPRYDLATQQQVVARSKLLR
jgi:hypothetical protein